MWSEKLNRKSKVNITKVFDRKSSKKNNGQRIVVIFVLVIPSPKNHKSQISKNKMIIRVLWLSLPLYIIFISDVIMIFFYGICKDHGFKGNSMNGLTSMLYTYYDFHIQPFRISRILWFLYKRKRTYSLKIYLIGRVCIFLWVITVVYVCLNCF